MTAAQPQAEDPRLVDADERLARIAEIEHVYRAKLDVARSANGDDQRFVTGTTHAYAALDRIKRALAGETDLVKLGIADPETQPAAAPEPASLFDETPGVNADGRPYCPGCGEDDGHAPGCPAARAAREAVAG